MKLFDCDYCDGHGEIELGEAPGGRSGSIEMYYGDCPACKGKGGEAATNYKMLAVWGMTLARQPEYAGALEEDDIPF